jgi:hypothetical protein
MRGKLVWTATAAIVMGAVIYHALSSVAMTGTMSYDLVASAPSADQNRSWLYRVGQLILPLLYSHDTQYGSQYREEVFGAVRPGATEDEIRTSLGEPVHTRRLEDGRSMWHYTEPGPKTQDFFVRIVEFDSAGRVLRTRSEFYVD